jgi:hypothetical protein
MISIGNFYLNPQFGFVDKWFGFSINAYWDNNERARYITLHLGFINLSVSLNIGIKK